MSRRFVPLVFTVVVIASCSLSGLRPGACNTDHDCPAGNRCMLDSPGAHTCVPSDGGLDGLGGNGGNGGHGGSECTAISCSGTKPICDSTTKMCRGCTTGDCGGADAGAPVCAASGACVECAADSDCKVGTKPVCDMSTNTCRGCVSGTAECSGVSAGTPVCAPTGGCVGCLANTDCTTATKPICDMTNICRACAADAECPASPGVCMPDGHCATTGEVIFVQSLPSGCPAADGSSASPYCAPNDAVAAVTTTRHVIIIVGAMGSRMTLATTGKSPVVIGRKDSGGNVGSIPANNMTAIAISSDTVLISDLTVNAGTTSTSTGVLVTGSSTNVTLLRMTTSLGTGLGIDAESGATLSMNGCVVQSNSMGGGILLNGAAFDIEDTTVSNNGPSMDLTWGGIRVQSPPSGGATLKLVTVENNMGAGISCTGTVAGMGVLASGNSPGNIAGGCGLSSCGTAGPMCGAQ